MTALAKELAADPRKDSSRAIVAKPEAQTTAAPQEDTPPPQCSSTSVQLAPSK